MAEAGKDVAGMFSAFISGVLHNALSYYIPHFSCIGPVVNYLLNNPFALPFEGVDFNPP